MKLLTIAVSLALLSPAAAQTLDMPKTIKFYDNKTGETVATVTMSGNSAYLRNKAGEHFATIVRGPNGTRTIYDPNGKEIDEQSLRLPKLPEEP